MKNTYTGLAALMVALAIALGAFGAHILNPGLAPKYVGTLGTANQYNLIISIALLFIGYMTHQYGQLKTPYWIILIGLVFFCGSLYTIVGCKYLDIKIPFIAGPMTPVGGMLMIIGWIWVAKIFYQKKI